MVKETEEKKTKPEQRIIVQSFIGHGLRQIKTTSISVVKETEEKKTKPEQRIIVQSFIGHGLRQTDNSHECGKGNNRGQKRRRLNLSYEE